MRRLLIACFETPGYGGASTATYALFERIQREGSPVSYVNLIDRSAVPFLRGAFGEEFDNPRRLANVHTHTFDGRFHDRQPRLTELIAGCAPDVILAVGYIAALAMKNAAPSIPLIFLTAGCDQIDRYLEVFGDARRVCDALQSSGRPVLFHRHERRAVEAADLVVTHSSLVHELYDLFYPDALGKVYPDVVWMAEWIYADAARSIADARPFDERDIDLLFVASRWARPEKNFALARQIVAGCPTFAAHIVGAALPTPVPAATTHGLMTSRSELFSLMGRAKTLVCPSSWDAAPGILFEAAALGCNVVASQNCGNWRLCHEELLVRSYRLEAFVERAQRAVERQYRSNVDEFLCSRSYETLLDIVDVL
jgi:glycosyltransferase involved in cell wall biosynthesis